MSTARELAELLEARVRLVFPAAAKVDLAETSSSIWLYLPNGQTFEIAVVERAPRYTEEPALYRETVSEREP